MPKVTNGKKGASDRDRRLEERRRRQECEERAEEDEFEQDEVSYESVHEENNAPEEHFGN